MTYSYYDQIDPSGNFDSQEKELERQRQLAIALYKNTIGAANQNAQASGPYNGIAAALGQIIGGTGIQNAERDFTAKQAEIDRNKQAATQNWYKNMPQVTPGQPGGDIAADGMGPPTPTILPKAPTASDYANWGATAPQTPEAQKVAIKLQENLLPQPASQRYHVTNEGVLDNFTQSWLPASPQHMEVVQERQRILEQAADQRHEAAMKNAETASDRAAEVARHNAVLEQLRSNGSQVAGKIIPSGDTTLDGKPVLRNTVTGTFHIQGPDGVPDPTPYAGPLLNAAENKQVGEISGIINDSRMARQLADQVASKPQVFSGRANIGNTVSGLAGGLGRETLTGLSAEDMQLRGLVMRDFAATTKQLYGASFTQSEQARANSFVPQSQDSADVIRQKLLGAAQFNDEMAQKYGGKIFEAAKVRSVGAQQQQPQGMSSSDSGQQRDNPLGMPPANGRYTTNDQQAFVADRVKMLQNELAQTQAGGPNYSAKIQPQNAMKNSGLLPQMNSGKTVVRTGRTPDGRKAVQYSDGTVEIQ